MNSVCIPGTCVLDEDSPLGIKDGARGNSGGREVKMGKTWGSHPTVGRFFSVDCWARKPT